jgi:excisionase family DNA binding protein
MQRLSRHNTDRERIIYLASQRTPEGKYRYSANQIVTLHGRNRNGTRTVSRGGITTTPILRLIPPQKVADSDQVAPIQHKLEDTAQLLSVSRRTVERLIERGELATVGLGKLKRVPYDSIVAYQNRHRNDEVA